MITRIMCIGVIHYFLILCHKQLVIFDRAVALHQTLRREKERERERKEFNLTTKLRPNKLTPKVLVCLNKCPCL